MEIKRKDLYWNPKTLDFQKNPEETPEPYTELRFMESILNMNIKELTVTDGQENTTN